MSLAGRVKAWVRRSWPDRTVHREVQGVRLALPWSHRLPDYARRHPGYGQNLVAVAELVARHRGRPIGVVDVGANVGDSALQVLAKVEGSVVCVEGDPYWLDYLRRNVDGEPRIQVVPALVVPDAAAAGDPVEALRRAGTTRFVSGDPAGQAGAGGAAQGLTPAELRALPDLPERIDLVKSDTDGYDARIVPAIAAAWRDDRPVLFFEYDPGMTRDVGDAEPEQVWSRLSELGYDRVVVWDNVGGPVGSLAIADAAVASAVLDQPLQERGYHYWDVAVIHRDDAALTAAIEELVGGRHGFESAQREP